jgi:hypothetical protein
MNSFSDVGAVFQRFRRQRRASACSIEPGSQRTHYSPTASESVQRASRAVEARFSRGSQLPSLGLHVQSRRMQSGNTYSAREMHTTASVRPAGGAVSAEDSACRACGNHAMQ